MSFKSIIFTELFLERYLIKKKEQLSSKIKFFKEAVKNIKTLGTVAPSSRFLSKRMLREINFSKADVLVELGPGNGAITKYILERLSPKATLICFEINDNFYRQLQDLKHPQLIVLKASAENIIEELKKLHIYKVNYIISSLPLTIIPDEVSDEILDRSFEILAKNGSFIQFQYSLSYFKKLKKVFKESISLEFEPLNIPPAFIYRCKKVE
ncbi:MULTISPECIES: class I SAM-dependent methyltransferase [unclassified Polaribacter]|uniref:class I SAM-dependent methyltransferase n=1 Tax=unclassified Polaribacter TaxID=196858 RepID=UPI001CB97F92|nr:MULTISPECIES: rRNA adenine N-6-methyltransferase family protein [unclassified Polaribacter]